MLNFFGDLCGYVYISSSDFIYYCVVCENIFKSCNEFQDHSLKEHFQLNSIPANIDKTNNELKNLPISNIKIETIEEIAFTEICDQQIDDLNEILENTENAKFHLDLESDFNDVHNDVNKESLISNSINNLEENKDNTTFPNHSHSVRHPNDIVHQININWLPFDLNDLDDIHLKCKYCKKQFSKLSTLKEHTKNHLNFILTCNICGRHSSRRSHAETHKQSHCKKKCNLCDFSYSTETALEKHLKRHELLKCKYCSKIFKKFDALQNHLRTHTGEKPFKCNVCSAAFALKRNLQTHIITQHTGDIKNFVCKFCDRKFKTKQLADWHTKRVHLKEKPNQCEFCGLNFANMSGLRRHKLKRHTEYNQRPHHCPHCEKKFVELRNLTEHMNTHTGDRPFQCDICLKAFGQTSGLREHKKLHTGKKAYLCKICEKTFAQHAGLANHMKQHQLINKFS